MSNSDVFSNHCHVMVATWSLSASVPLAEAVDFAHELIISKMGQKLLDVHVYKRENKKKKTHRHYIGFKYLMETPGESAHDDYFHVFNGMFEKRFGKKIVGWSVSSPVTMIKHVGMQHV